MKNRLEHIDAIRGISMIAMVLIHTNAYFLHVGVARVLWDACQFAVPVFVFCSAYLFFNKENHAHIAHTFGYFRKRIVRLLAPYYLFLAAYGILVLVFEPDILTSEFVRKSLLLTGGIDLNWMVLLFLLISAVMPPLMYLWRRLPMVFYAYFALAAATAAALLFFSYPGNFRIVMIVPWTLVVITTWSIAYHECNPRRITLIAAVAAILYAASRLILDTTGQSLVQFDNKYPPNLFHISYGVLWILTLFAVFKHYKLPGPIRAFVRYYSLHSYSLFFIHFFLIFLSTYILNIESVGWMPFFLVILFASYGVRRIYEIFAHRLSTLKSGPTI